MFCSPVDGACRLTLSAQGYRLAISTRKRRLVLLERNGREFTVVKDFSPLKLAGPADPAVQPTWCAHAHFTPYTVLSFPSPCCSAHWLLFSTFSSFDRCVVDNRIGEEKLLLPGAPQLRSSCKANAWEEAKEVPALREADAPSHLALLQHCGSVVGEKALDVSGESGGAPVVCGVSAIGELSIWRMQQKRPLVMIQSTAAVLYLPYSYCLFISSVRW